MEPERKRKLHPALVQNYQNFRDPLFNQPLAHHIGG